jgi:ribose 5-phosphate isomerase A
MKDIHASLEGKRRAGEEAARRVQSGMKVGLGTGSTTAFAIAELGRRVREEGLKIECCVTSFSSQNLAIEAGLRPLPVESFDRLDISIDGADEVDPQLRLIKGGGAAHTREKIVHALSSLFLCIVDPSKLVSQLGAFRVPVEFLPVSLKLVQHELEKLGGECALRMAVRKDGPVVTDNGNLIFDVAFGAFDAEQLEKEINSIPGVIENGIFARYRPNEVIVGDSELRFLKRE